MAMSDANERIEMVQHDDGAGNHRLAIGLLAGTAVGVGLGMLLAPRKGSELRKQVKVQATHVASSCSNGYHRAADKAGAWAHRGRDAYHVCRDKVAHGTHETRRYVREVADAVTTKSRSQVTAPPQVIAPGKVPTATASHAQAEQPRAREQAREQHEAKKDLRAV